MDRKRIIQCLSNASQHVPPIYLQQFLRYSKLLQYIQPFWYSTSVWRTDGRIDERTDVQPISTCITCFSIADARKKGYVFETQCRLLQDVLCLPTMPPANVERKADAFIRLLVRRYEMIQCHVIRKSSSSLCARNNTVAPTKGVMCVTDHREASRTLLDRFCRIVGLGNGIQLARSSCGENYTVLRVMWKYTAFNLANPVNYAY